MAEELLTVQDVADRLKITAATVRRWLRAGDLRGIALGERAGYRIPVSELERFLAARANYERQDGQPEEES
jgi:excisionase family DNA binding protein